MLDHYSECNYITEVEVKTRQGFLLLANGLSLVVMDETRPSPFFALFRFRGLYWTQTEEQKTGKAWERG